MKKRYQGLRGILAAAFGLVLGAAVSVTGTVMTSQAAENVTVGTWVLAENGGYYYLDASGTPVLNTVTPDGYYVDETGLWRPETFELSKLTTIPADAASLMVIEGYGKAAHAVFYKKQSVPEAGTLSPIEGPGAETVTQTGTASYQWVKITDTGAYIGRNGLGKEREGDSKTPVGLFSLDQAFGTSPALSNFSVPYLQVDSRYYWVGDSNSPLYNQMVDINQTGAVFDTSASEHLSTYGGKAYNYCMSVGYNKEGTPHLGSAIFLHCMDGAGTGGCISIPEAAMIQVLQNVAQPAYILIAPGGGFGAY